jgi:hypothetical protein
VGLTVTPPGGGWGGGSFRKGRFYYDFFFHVWHVLYVNSCTAVFAVSLEDQAKVDPTYLFLNSAQKFTEPLIPPRVLNLGSRRGGWVVGWRHVPAAIALRVKTLGF